MKYTADFETTNDKKDCRVWAWAICNVNDTEDYRFGNNMDSFMDELTRLEEPEIYFHNLKFDGEFIINWLFKNDYEHYTGRKPGPGQFTTLISDMGQFYAIKLMFRETLIDFYDSLKIIPFSVAAIAKAFNLPISKLEIDYDEYRPVGHKLTQQEKDYLENDVKIMAMALKTLFDQNMTKMTAGSNALHQYKEIKGIRKFKGAFPILESDGYLRKAYRGAFTYANPIHQGKDIGEGIVLDVNSLYSSVMYYCDMPYGQPIFFEGEYKHDPEYPLTIQRITCNLELKKGRLPTVQLKGSRRFLSTEYVTSTNGEPITLHVTNVDLHLLLEQYDITELDYIDGYKFKASKLLFRDYIDKWMAVKQQASIEGNGGMRTLAKLMLNSFYGKFATNPKVQSKIPYYENGVHYRLGEPEMRKPVYVPIGIFVTSWGRYKTITSAQSVYDRFLYADTDSLHLIGNEIPPELEVHDTKLGAWAVEAYFTKGRYIRAKTYAEEIDGKMVITCAGMPKACHKHVTWDNFYEGNSFAGKLMPRHVDGGIVLEPIFFTIQG